jgi:hypothetical protein
MSLSSFGYKKYKGSHGLTFDFIENKKYDYNKLLLGVHGIGLGNFGYFKAMDHIPKYKYTILVEMPNMSFGEYVKDYPNNDQIVESINKFVSAKLSSIITSQYIDLLGHSFGTTVISRLCRASIGKYKDTFWGYSIDNVILIDPVCFFETFHQVLSIMSEEGKKRYITNQLEIKETDTLKIRIKKIFDRLYNSLIYNGIIKNIDTQKILLKELLLYEILFPLEFINNKLIVILAEFDIYIDVETIYKNLSALDAQIIIIKEAIHADAILEKDVTMKMATFLKDSINSNFQRSKNV